MFLWPHTLSVGSSYPNFPYISPQTPRVLEENLWGVMVSQPASSCNCRCCRKSKFSISATSKETESWYKNLIVLFPTINAKEQGHCRQGLFICAAILVLNIIMQLSPHYFKLKCTLHFSNISITLCTENQCSQNDNSCTVGQRHWCGWKPGMFSVAIICSMKFAYNVASVFISIKPLCFNFFFCVTNLSIGCCRSGVHQRRYKWGGKWCLARR